MIELLGPNLVRIKFKKFKLWKRVSPSELVVNGAPFYLSALPVDQIGPDDCAEAAVATPVDDDEEAGAVMAVAINASNDPHVPIATVASSGSDGLRIFNNVL